MASVCGSRSREVGNGYEGVLHDRSLRSRALEIVLGRYLLAAEVFVRVRHQAGMIDLG